jgi:hypothetical protein
MVGQTLGVAVVGSVATSGVTRSVHDELAAASHPAWWLIIALATVVVAGGVAATTKAARASAEAEWAI